MSVVDLIPYGRKNAIKRAELLRNYEGNDREMRREIQDARNEEIIINLSDGRGYFRPESRSEIAAYIAQETARARTIERNIRVAKRKLAEVDGQTTLDV